jgi:hypothetical protein
MATSADVLRRKPLNLRRAPCKASTRADPAPVQISGDGLVRPGPFGSGLLHVRQHLAGTEAEGQASAPRKAVPS